MRRPGSPRRRCGGLIDADPRLGKCGRHVPERDPERGPADVASPAKGLRSSRATPYWLLLPGMAWLGVFFVIPLVSLFSTSLQSPVSDNPDDGYYFNWDFANYTEALSRLRPAVPALVRVRRHGDPAGAGDRLPAGVLHRLQGRQVQGAAARPGHRAVLRLVPDPHLRVEDDPGRRGLHRADDERPEPAAGRPDPQHPDRGHHRHHVQLPAVHDPAAVRGAGEDRPAADRGGRATSTRRRSRRSAR